ncbi:MAG: hypothetical protein ACRDOX_04225, partial [Nocardioides sp.]
MEAGHAPGMRGADDEIRTRDIDLELATSTMGTVSRSERDSRERMTRFELATSTLNSRHRRWAQC